MIIINNSILTNLLIGAVKMDFSKMAKFTNQFISGTMTTLAITIITVILGSIIGFLITLLRRSKFKPLNLIAKIYAQIMRGTPVLLQIYIVVYGLPMVGIRTPEFPIPFIAQPRQFIACIIALSLNSGAYISEIFRAGLSSIDSGQSEAARSLGLSSSQTMKHVVLPQAIKNIIPALGNEFIMMIKESSMVSVVGIKDVMYVRSIAASSTYLVFEPLIIIALIYFLLTSICTTLLGLLEKRLNTDD